MIFPVKQLIRFRESININWFIFILSFFLGCHNSTHLRAQKLLKPGEKSATTYDPETGAILKKANNQTFDPETGKAFSKNELKFDPKTGKSIKNSGSGLLKPDQQKNSTYHIEKLALKNARINHRKFVWTLAGITAPGTSCGLAISSAVVFDEILDGDGVGFIGFVGGGVFGMVLPSVLAISSTKNITINYPNTLNTDREKSIYKDTYIKQAKLLRTKSVRDGLSTTLLTIGALLIVALFGG